MQGQLRTTKHLQSASGLSGLFSLATLLVFVLTQNADWGSNRLLWWGSIGFFLFTFWVERNGFLTLDSNYTLWVLAFTAISAVSFLWAANASIVVSLIKSMVINAMVFLLLRSAIKREEDVTQILAVLLFAIVITIVWLLITNRDMFEQTAGSLDSETDRLGADGGKWNANGIGMMAATGMLIALYLRKRTDKLLLSWGYLAVIPLMILAVLLSGSRKALVMILMGFCGFVYLAAKGKRLRAMIVIVLVVLALYYLVMEVPFFRSVIGVRVKGFIASLTGVGEVDSSTLKREAYVKEALWVWKEHPILGVGLDCFRVFNRVDADIYAHNNYVELLADLGVVGAVIYYSAHMYCLIGLLKIKKKDMLVWLLLIVLMIQLVMDYGCVSYTSLSDGTLRMLMFSVISIRKRQKEDCQSAVDA